MDYISRLNAERRTRVRMDEAIAKKKMEEVRRKKLEDTRIAVAKKIQEEQAMIAAKEQEVLQMELLEMELIKKL